jgi:hypothetical protein
LGWALLSFVVEGPRHGWRLAAGGVTRSDARSVPSAAFDHAADVRAAIDPWCGALRPLVVVEAMVHSQDRDGSVAQDLIDLSIVSAYVAGTVCGAARTPQFLPAMTWKGGVPKDIHHERIRAALDPEECVLLRKLLESVPKRYEKELLDALGIALYGAGRIARGGRVRE